MRVVGILVVATLAGLVTVVGRAADDSTRLFRGPDGLRTLQVYSPKYKIDRIYRSMEGPLERQEVNFTDGGSPLLLWIVGYRTEIVEAETHSLLSPEYMCHNNLDFDTVAHRKLFVQQGFDERGFKETRVVTLSQGQLSMQLPKGFGFPIMSSENLRLTTQVLNLNDPNIDISVQPKISLEFMMERDLKTPLRPLLPTFAGVEALVEGEEGIYRPNVISNVYEQTSCSPGQHALHAKTVGLYEDISGRTFSNHWIVKPGREVRRTRVTRQMGIPFDTTIHYIAIHLHPFAESLMLRDVTADRDLWVCHPKLRKKGIGLEHVDDYSSPEGIAVYKDHEYELVSVYNNTSGVDQDAMAVMYIYLLDKAFKKPG